ncbi:hypothetical protein CPC08DRAFT_750193 [Agrocybe pediades]|nr:hypothetical protein CPC08DRAFT_750193 [Agrocybe pediades]
MRSLFFFVCALAAQLVAATDEYRDDPYLAYRPPFARSLPVQIMLTGVVLTLVAVLFIHLMFTAQYHWPLAPVNYVLQLSGVTTLLISLIATIHVVLSTAFAESEKWPYMLSYIAVNVPPLDTVDNASDEGWSTAEKATWLVMNASTSGLIQITHIQFLTLLYPSKLEGRLIFALLGPLAVVAAIMQLLAISSTSAVQDIADVVRNVCNATLSLLFTIALFIWGLLVNRKKAWRTDGGTAVFGAAALSLAVVSTALNFLYIHKAEEFVWLPGLMWAVVLWQSFLGWWWWVGAGSGGTFGGSSDANEAVEEKIRRRQKREARRKEKMEKRKETKLRAQKVWKDVAGAFIPGSSSSTTAAHSTSAQSRDPASASGMHTRSRPSGAADDDVNATNPITPVTTTGTNATASTSPTLTRTTTIVTVASNSSLSSTSTVTSTSLVTTTTASTSSPLPQFLPAMVHRWYAYLRHAHNAAARVQAAERVERIRELNLERERENAAGGGDRGESGQRQAVVVEGVGWGWEGFGWRRRRRKTPEGAKGFSERSVSRGRDVNGRRRRRNDEDDVDGNTFEMRPTSRSASRHRPRSSEREKESDEDEDDMYVSEVEDDVERRQRRREREREQDSQDSYPYPTDTQNQNSTQTRYVSSLPLHNPYLEDSVPSSSSSNHRPANAAAAPAPVAMERPRSLWWWGPLWRWRLQDSTVYK